MLKKNYESNNKKGKGDVKEGKEEHENNRDDSDDNDELKTEQRDKLWSNLSKYVLHYTSSPAP